MDTFKRDIETLLLKNDDYRLPNSKGLIVTDKLHPVHEIVVNNIPQSIKEKLYNKKIENIEHIKFKGSTGDGLVGESYWVALLDERVTTSTTNGIYIVLLFDKTLEYVFLAIAFGTENINLTKIREIADERRKIFSIQIENNFNLNGFSTNDIYLGDKTRAKKFAASACIHKKYETRQLNIDELTDDIAVLNDLYYNFLYENYTSEGLGSVEEDKENVRRRVIKSKKYDQLRTDRDARNKITGDLAEEYIYNLEKEKLNDLGLNNLAENVDWIAKNEDGHGFDIISFFPDGSKKYIEVKGSTLASENFIFYLSSNEKLVAEELGDLYVLALVENVGSDNIKVFDEIINPMKKINDLIPINFRGFVSRN